MKERKICVCVCVCVVSRRGEIRKKNADEKIGIVKGGTMNINNCKNKLN